MVNRNLPSGWKWISLQDCVDILDNQRIPINREEREKRIIGKDKSKLYPYYGATGLIDWIDDYIFDEEIILLGEDGAPFLESNKEKAYLVKGKCWVNNHAHVLRAKKELITILFLMHYLNTFDYHDYVTGTTRYKLNQSRMREFPIPLPPLPEQERIVERIESLFTQLDAGLAGLKRAKAALKRYKASVLKAACEGRLVPQDPSDESANSLLDQIIKLRHQPINAGIIKKSNSLPEIKDEEKTIILPSGWIWSRLDDICSDIVDIAHKMPKDVENGVKFISAKDLIDNGKINFEVDVKRISEMDYETLAKRVKPERNDIIYSRIGARLGKARVVDTDQKFMISYSCCVIRPLIVNVKYLSYYLDSGIVLLQARTQTKSIGVPDLGMSQIKSFVIAIPPLSEQYRIVTDVERRLSVAQNLEQTVEANLKRATRLRQAILKRAFEGRLVKQDINVESVNGSSEKPGDYQEVEEDNTLLYDSPHIDKPQQLELFDTTKNKKDGNYL